MRGSRPLTSPGFFEGFVFSGPYARVFLSAVTAKWLMALLASLQVKALRSEMYSAHDLCEGDLVGVRWRGPIVSGLVRGGA